MADLTISVDINATGTKRGAGEAVRSVDTITSAAMKLKERLSGINFAAIGKRIQDFGNQIKDVGGQLQGMGTTLTGIFTVPLAAIATLGVKSALEIDAIRTKITALVGDQEKATRKIAELRDLANRSVGVTQKGALETFAQLKGIGEISEAAINKMIVSMGKLNAAFKIDDQDVFMRNLTQIFSQDFERPDIKEAIGRVPFFEQLLESAFGTKDGEQLKAMKAAGKITMESFFAGIADAINNDPRVGNIGESLSTKIAKSMERLNVALGPLGDVILSVIVPAIEKLSPYIERLGRWFAQLSPEIQMAIAAFGAFVAVLGPLLFIIGGIVTAFGAFVAALGAIVSSAAAVGIALGVVVGLIVQLGPVLAIVAAQVYVLYQAWQTNFAGIRDLTFEVAAAVQERWNAALIELSALTSTMLAQVTAFWTQHGEEIKATLLVIETAIRERLEAIRAFWSQNGDEIMSIVRTVWNVIKVLVTEGLDNMLLAIRAVAALIRGDWKTFWDSTASILKNVLDIWVSILAGGLALVVKAVRAIFIGVFELKGWVAEQSVAIGIAMVEGIIKGILSLQIYLIKTAAGLIQRAVTAMKEAAKIESPSKVTEEIGTYMAEGLGVGMDSGAGEVAKSAKGLSSTITEILGGDIGGFISSAFDILTDSSRSWGDRLKTIFGGIVQNFKGMVGNMASATSGFFGGQGSSGGGSGGGGLGGFLSNIFSGQGGANGSRTGDIFNGASQVFGGDKGRGDIFSNLKNTFSTKDGGLFAERGGSKLAGIAGGAGDIAAMVGGLIGGRAGGIISSVGKGVSMGSMFGPWGALIGGGIGLIAGLFGGDPKRKRDKNEKLPELNRGFTDAMAELRALVGDVRTLRVSPDAAIGRATELRNAIASGFGIQFESKKYKKQAATITASRVREADTLIAELRNAAEVARAAGERQRRIIPEFATGIYMSREFTRQLGDYKRLNGMMPGKYSGRDSINARIGAGEMVLNPMQQQNVRANAGLDPFRNAGIPGYAAGAGPSAGGAAGSGGSMPELTLVFEHSIDSNGMVKTALKNSPDVTRELRIKIEDLSANDRLTQKRRGV